MGYIVKAMLAWADIIVIDYGSSRLVHAVGLGYPERTAAFLQAAVLLNAVKRPGIASKKNGNGESCMW